MKRDECKSCGAAIFWAETPKGQAHPVDFEPNPSGNLEVHEANDPRDPPLVVMNPKGHGTVVRYMSHFGTCPDSKTWSKSASTKPTPKR